MKRTVVAVAAATLVLTAACSTSPVDTTRTVSLDGIGNQPGSTLIAPNGAAGQQSEQPANESNNPDPAKTPDAEQAESAAIESQDPGAEPDEDIVADIEDLLDSLDDLDDLLGGLDDDLGDLDESFEEDEGDIEG